MRHVNFNSAYRLGKSKHAHCPTCEAYRFQQYLAARDIKIRIGELLFTCELFECHGCGAVNTIAANSEVVTRSQPMLMLAEALDALKRENEPASLNVNE